MKTYTIFFASAH